MVQQPAQPQVVVIQQQSNAPQKENTLGCCPESMVEVSDCMALTLLILQCISPGTGAFYGSCLDRKGCNCNAFGVSLLQSGLAALIVGWVWSIMWGCAVRTYNQGNV